MRNRTAELGRTLVGNAGRLREPGIIHRRLKGAVMVLLLFLCGGIKTAAQEQPVKGSPESEARVHTANGARLVRSGEFQAAKEELEKAIALDPQSSEAHTFLGIALNQLEKYEEAIAAFQKALQLDPDSVAAHYNLSISLLRLQKNDEAIQELQQVVKLNPQLADARYNLGFLLAKKGHFQEAIEHLEALKAEPAGDPAALIHLITAYFKVGNESRALELAKEAMKEDDVRATLSTSLGVLLLEHGHYEEALPALRKAHLSAPESLELAAYLARAYLELNRPAEAIQLVTGFRNRESSWELNHLLGLAHLATGEADIAEPYLRQAVQLKPDEPAVRYNLGRLLLKSRDRDKQKDGVQELEEALKLAPRQSAYYITLGRWLVDQYELESAIELLRRAINMVPPSVELYLLLGLAEGELHGSAAARPIIEKALQLNPQIGVAYSLLGNTYLRTGDYENALKHYKKAAELNPENDIYFYDVALVLDRLNKTAEALLWAEKATELKPDRSFNHYMLGKLYAKLGRKVEAIRQLETCVGLDPEIEYAYYLLGRTYRQLGDHTQAQQWSRKLVEMRAARVRADVERRGPRSSSQPPMGGPPAPWETIRQRAAGIWDTERR